MDTLRGDKKARSITAVEAASMVKPGMWLDLGGVNAQSETFDKALAARRDELTDVNIRSCLSIRPLAFLEADPRASTSMPIIGTSVAMTA